MSDFTSVHERGWILSMGSPSGIAKKGILVDTHREGIEEAQAH